MKRLLLPVALLLILGLNLPAKDNQRVVEYNGRITPKDIIEVYGHRGIRALAPEQTMPAYKAALMIGIDYVDMDINMTKDGSLIITHDLGLNQDFTKDENEHWISNATPIHHMALKEIQNYKVGEYKAGSNYANLFPNQAQIKNVHLPTLLEAIKFVKKIAGNKVGFQIEIKNDPTEPGMSATPKEYARKLYKILKEHNIIDRSEIQAFDWRNLIELNKIDSNIKTAYLTDLTSVTLLDSEKGTWMAGLKPKDFDHSYPKMVKHLGGYCWEPFIKDLTKKDLDEAHRLGLKVVPWGWAEEEKTDFDYDMMLKVIDWKVDGIITDRPDILRGILSSRNYNVPEGFIIENGFVE
jgi:glycerophosphoryl diester phosphodiesterase